VAATQGKSHVLVDPGDTVDFEVRGRLSDLANEGLAGFAFDLAYEGESLVNPVDPGAGMINFVRPNGITNSAGFGGIPIDGALAQIGGAQNTINNQGGDFLIGTVDTGLGHDEIILATGTVRAPAVQGAYRLVASNVSATMIKEGETGPVYATEPVRFNVTEDLVIGVGGIPTVSEWGVIIMTFLMLTTGTLVYMGRRRVGLSARKPL
jgi:hypothetical protein